MQETNEPLNLIGLFFGRFVSEGAYFILGLILVFFLGMPLYFMGANVIEKYLDYNSIKNLQTNFKSTTGVIIAVYNDLSEIVQGVNPTIIEYRFSTDGKLRKDFTRTLDKAQSGALGSGDSVVILYNERKSMLEHIKPHFASREEMAVQFALVFGFLFLPVFAGFTIIAIKLNEILHAVALHKNGIHAKGEVTYFKHHRDNSYIVEYLYKPEDYAVRMRHKCRAGNYEHVGEKAIGEEIDILYDPKHPTRTCINEFVNYA